MIYDARCKECDHLWEYLGKAGEGSPPCELCGTTETIRVWTSVPILDKAKDPYDLLNGTIPDSKPIRSFAKDHRKGGKDVNH